jgi:hypothetical protein
MKYVVITDAAGKVLGTAQLVEGTSDAGSGGPVAGAGERRHVVELSGDAAEAGVDDLHRLVAERLAEQ